MALAVQDFEALEHYDVPSRPGTSTTAHFFRHLSRGLQCICDYAFHQDFFFALKLDNGHNMEKNGETR